jgi:hypothetical protein
MYFLKKSCLKEREKGVEFCYSSYDLNFLLQIFLYFENFIMMLFFETDYVPTYYNSYETHLIQQVDMRFG